MSGDTSYYSIKAGCYLEGGGREYQEDRLSIQRDLNDFHNYYFGVFDGHGGYAVSNYLANNFHISLAQHAKFNLLPITALQECWSQMDDQCYQELRRIQSTNSSGAFPVDGSTATVCCIIGNDIYITNCGDSAAYSIMDNGSYEKLTEDHGTHNPSEVKRCELMGGQMSHESYKVKSPFPCCCCGKQTKSNKPRIYPGGLLVTRAFGDFYAKKEWLGGKSGVVIPQHGNVSYINLERSSLKYLILASDGVWDVMEIEEVVTIINNTLSKGASTKSNVKKVSPSEKRSQKEDVTGSVGSILADGFVAAAESSLDPALCLAANRVVTAAVTSKNWSKLGCRADNTSCIIVSIERSGNSSPEDNVSKQI